MCIRDRPLNTYLDQTFTCSCGKEHYAPLKVVRIGPSALNDLPRIAREQGFQSLYLVSDTTTYQIAGKRCLELLEAAGAKAKLIQLTHTGFDEATLGCLLYTSRCV